MTTITTVLPSGLFLTPDFITEAEERELVLWLDQQPWSTELSRRTQHYGYQYNYTNRSIQVTVPLTGPLSQLQQKFGAAGHNLTQCIVNEYYRDQGIAPHIDLNIFGPVIVGVSLGADAVMSFERSTNNNMESFECFLPRRSLLMLTGEARSQWKHSISKRVTYLDSTGHKINKDINYRRISCTFRSVIDNQ
jgi:alkylated DNA repair dioxygenase AlkB